ncbi:hypothetical protein KGQ20_13775 [Catenulispora sp. NF23]|nr:hypothetical protein [Catenulispora pinistramenti]
MAGQKSWEVRGTSRPHPMYRDVERHTEPPEDVIRAGIMSLGDVMHIPRGYWHTATRVGSGDGYSLRVALGTTRLNHLSDVVRVNDMFRTDLEGDGAADPRLLITGLSNLAIGHHPANYLADLRATTPAPRLMPYVSAFGPLHGLAAVTEFERAITSTKDAIAVVAVGRHLTFASTTEGAVRTMLSGNPVDVIGADDTWTLAAHLLKEGVCEPLTVESFSGYIDLVPTVACSNLYSLSA